ncbi:MAG TPA: response regulator transcription factor [Candidatus Limnocylindrales bacterium]|nr:response regulator transcription factor [Candidatus Limnocylindrales bacterium]
MIAGTSRPDGPIVVLVVEDHRLLAEGLVSLLRETPDFAVLDSVATVRDAVSLAGEYAPDVVLMDSRLADGTGCEAAARIRRLNPRIAVVFLSADDSDDAVLAAVESGACGYLSKSVAGTQLRTAIRGAASGQMLVPADRLAALAGHQERLEARARARGPQVSDLTSRERQVLSLLAGGLDNRQIAARLGIAYGTARTHVRNLLEKIGVHSRLEAVMRAGERGLLL